MSLAKISILPVHQLHIWTIPIVLLILLYWLYQRASPTAMQNTTSRSFVENEDHHGRQDSLLEIIHNYTRSCIQGIWPAVIVLGLLFFGASYHISRLGCPFWVWSLIIPPSFLILAILLYKRVQCLHYLDPNAFKWIFFFIK